MNDFDGALDEQGMGGGAMVGEIRCLMCSRRLADVVDGTNGRARLVPPAGRSAAPILVERLVHRAAAAARAR
jgi:hypothetical protein